MSIKVRWSLELRTQTRRLKRDTYHAALYVSIQDDRGEDNYQRAAGFVTEAVDAAAKALCLGPITVERVSGSISRWNDDLKCYVLGTSFGVKLTAKRAADVVAYRLTFLDAVDAPAIESALVGAFEAGLAAWRARTAAESAALAACQLADHWAKEARERADKACRYAQRVAALKAEFSAECSVQAEEVAAEVQSDPQSVPKMHDGSAIAPEAVAAALKALPAALGRLNQDAFFRSHDPLVKPEDMGGAK